MPQAVQYRRWVGTLNNWEEHAGPDYFKNLKDICEGLITEGLLAYAVCGKETGDKEKTPHLQAFFAFKSARRPDGVRKLLDCSKWWLHGAYAKRDEAQQSYCSKQGEWWECGQLNEACDGGQAEQDRWKDMRELAKAGKFEELADKHPREATIFSKKWIEVYLTHMQSIIPQLLPEKASRANANFWLWGKPQLGKSWWARKGWGLNATMNGRYIKLHNKWFDDYRFEEVVIVDDLDAGEHTKNLALYKHLGDAYPFRAEVKGASCLIRPLCVIITSNLPMRDIFAGIPEEHFEAIRSRYCELEFVKRGESFEESVRDSAADEPRGESRAWSGVQ